MYNKRGITRLLTAASVLVVVHSGSNAFAQTVSGLTGSGVLGGPGLISPQIQASAAVWHKYYDAVAQGDAFAKKEDWKNAVQSYRQALDFRCGLSRQAYYGLAQCAVAAGDTEAEIKYYREAVNPSTNFDASRMPPGASPQELYPENDIDKIAHFVLLLAKASKGSEALKVYFYLSDLTRQQSYKFSFPNRKEYEESKWQYSPELVEAMADIAIAADSTNLTQMTAAQRQDLFRNALKLQPYSAAVWFYYAEELEWSHRPDSEATVAYKKALQYDHGEHPGLIEKRAKGSGISL